MRNIKKLTASSLRQIGELLPGVMNRIEEAYKKQPNRILQAWPEIIGEKLSPLTKAVSLKKGVLTIKVKSSTLHSLLSQHEKNRLLKIMQNRFSKEAIRGIVFRLG